MMPNMLPRVGRWQKSNVFYNTGHGHLGWTLSAITAHQLVGHVHHAALPAKASSFITSTTFRRTTMAVSVFRSLQDRHGAQ